MFEVFIGLFDMTGFPPRKDSGTGWTPTLIGLHVTSDLLIWLAYVSIPLVLLYFTRRRDLPFPRLFLLFALFILACGTTHLLDALIFEYPLYRLAGAMKAITAIVSWATVIALIPIIPRVVNAVTEASRPGTDTRLHRPLPTARPGRTRDYIAAILAGVLAVLVRAAINPVLQGDQVFVIALLTVVYVSWQYGFGPGIVCLVLGLCGYLYFFVPLRYTGNALGTQLAVVLFFFCGVACAALGESQRTAHRRARVALATAVARHEELESEVVRRRVVEAALREREADLVASQRETAEALARLNAFLDHAPLGIAFYDPELRYERINPFWAEANGKTVEEHIGRTLPEVFPDFPPEAVAAYRRVAALDRAPFTSQLRVNDARVPGAVRVWQATAFPVRGTDGQALGAGAIAQDVTDRLKAEEELRRSERNLADFFENANVGLHWVGPDGVILRANQAELDMLGYAREEYVGRSIAEFHADPQASRDFLARLQRGERLDNYPARLKCKTGGTRDVLISASALWEDGRLVHSRCFTRDITELKRAADELAEQARRYALRADVALALGTAADTRGALRGCAEALVRQVDAAFARVWSIDSAGQWLELQASAGLYTHIDGGHARVRVGEFKIGRIAKNLSPHLTNDVCNDPNVSDPQWAAREGMVSFAGFPLVVEGRLLGVVALFARHALSEGLIAELGPVAGSIAQYIDRRRATEAMRESEERFRGMADNAPALIWLSDTAGRRMYFNKTWLEFTGRGTEREIGSGWTENVHPDDRARYLTEYAAALADPRPFEIEYRLHRHDGAYRWLLARGTPRLTSHGAFTGFIGLCLDVTDRREAAELVRQSEVFRRSVFENSPDCLMILNLDGRILEINESGFGLMELDDAADVRGLPWSDLWPPANRETIREAVVAAGGGQTGRFQGFCPTAKGAPKYWDVSVVGLPGADGRPYRLIGVSRDITEQRRAEDAVRASELRFRSLTEAIPQLVWTADPQGRVTFFNRRWTEYTGAAWDAGVAAAWERDLLHPNDAEEFRAAWTHSVAKTNQPFNHEFRLLCAEDGEYRWMLAAAVPLLDVTGAVSEWVGTLTDIDDQKRQAQLLERLVAERTLDLKRSNDELEQFAYIASHDLQEPLRKIQAFGDRLRNKCREQLPENGREYVDRMMSAAGRMRRLIDDLLTFSRVTTQKRPFLRLDLGRVAREVASDLEIRITQAGGTVVIGNMPSVDADPMQMRQLFQNLIANAVKFHRPDVPPVVEVASELIVQERTDLDTDEPVPVCRITVRDNGIGFNEKYRDRIFDVFQRLHGRDEYEGTGVGLAICRKIVERHGGSIVAHGREGEGATFVVTLPVRQSHSNEATGEDGIPQ